MAGKEKDSSAEPMKAEENAPVAIVPTNESAIRGLIYTVRGTQIMLDSDLAALYGVETGNLNKAAGRNAERFPNEFRFKLTSDEWASLLFQIGRAKPQGRGGRRTPPYAYSEQGVAMLSAILKSKTAVRVSVQIMKSFVEMRHFIASNATMFEQVRDVELKLLEYQKTTDERFERVFDYMDTHEAPRQKVFFDGQVWDALELLVSLVRRAEREIVLIDGYVDTDTLSILAKKADGVNAIVWTHPRTRLDQHDVDIFNTQYPQLEIRYTTAFHDRFLIIDGTQGYFVGASLKDAGKKSFAISHIEGEELVSAILSRLERP